MLLTPFLFESYSSINEMKRNMKSFSFRLKRGELLLAKHFTFWIIVILLIWNKSLKIEVYFVRISFKKISVYSQWRFPKVRFLKISYSNVQYFNIMLDLVSTVSIHFYTILFPTLCQRGSLSKTIIRTLFMQ